MKSHVFLGGASPVLLAGVLVLLLSGAPLVSRAQAFDPPRPFELGPALRGPATMVAPIKGNGAPDDQPLVLPTEALPGDVYWSSGFGRRGIYGTVRTVCAADSSLYVGGSFSYAGTKRCNNVARWDGTDWQPMSTGVWLDGGGTKVTTFLPYQGGVLVGGLFDYAGGVPLEAVRVARWDGAAWSAMSASEWRDSVHQLIEYDGRLLAGGGFWSPSLGGYAGLLEWTGAEWVNGSTLTVAGDLCPREDYLLVLMANELRGWDGVNVWTEPEAVDCPHPATDFAHLESIVADESRMYVGGSFQCALDGDGLSVPANNVAAWDGQGWDVLGNGLDDADWQYWEESPVVWSLCLWGGDLFAGGDFLSSEAYPYGMRHVGRWDGSGWNRLGSGCSENVYALLPYDGRLAVGGWMGYAGDEDVWGIASWDGAAWSGFGAMGNGVNNPVYALQVYGDKLIAAGLFDRAGTTPANRIAAFDGVSWQPLGTGLQGFPPYSGVLGLGVYDGSLIVAGSITGAGGIPSPYVARWDGSAWHALGSGLPEVESAICVFEGQLYVGKYRWTGTDWELWLPADGPVRCLIVWNEELVAGGEFSTVDGVPMEKLVRWNGEIFSDVGGGIPGSGVGPKALAVYGGDLVVGGAFLVEESYSIARWDGSAWRGLATGLNLPVSALAVSGQYLFQGGFSDASFKRVAYWDGSSWHAMGSGCTGASYYRLEAKALALYQGSLYVGGDFSIAGYAPSFFIAKWRDPLVPVYLRGLRVERVGRSAVIRWEAVDAAAGIRFEVWRQEGSAERVYLGEVVGSGSADFAYRDAQAPVGATSYWLREWGREDADFWGPIELAARALPSRAVVTGAWPNPFNPRATVGVSLPRAEAARVAVYDVQGRLVRRLVAGELPAGETTVEWDGQDERGQACGSGTYVVRLWTPGGTDARKLVLAR